MAVTSDAVPPPSRGDPTSASEAAAGLCVSPIATPVVIPSLGSGEALDFTPVLEETLTIAGKQTLRWETGLQLFPAYQAGEVLLVTVVVRDRDEFPVKLKSRTSMGDFTCQAGWPAVRVAAGLKPGDSFGAIPPRLYPLNALGLRV